MNAYKNEIVAFLTKVRGPNPRNYDLKPLPRPTGEAAQVVITEFDMPRAGGTRRILHARWQRLDGRNSLALGRPCGA